ncbi:hypothetical protein LXL04_040181 [Taraxacum kok-saghyz]
MADEHRLAGVIRGNNEIEQREEGRRLFGKSPAPTQAPPRPAYNNAAPPANYDPQQQQGAPKRPWGPNRAHYPPLALPFLPYSPSF